MVNKRITDFQAPFQSTSKRILDMMNRKYFDPENAPARETVEVSNLPKYVRLEISVIACETD